MSLTEDKRRILEKLWEAASHALRPMELSVKLKVRFPTLIMHLVLVEKNGLCSQF